ncbi:hypothetical protein GPECTOR_1029g303 [Gonium pectorale]|uniref:Uncharacterized protein n=1 Tax=Gonium pectorale TaxID=33097 RepID=A0A150FTT9_GONPE|nr:hypothetical protein GPECTOR_1029g303 [Gonium pectorale]|eukprot:KXZ40996.1 hypothetical protein GPECTOR_1029g303 [Gonium pectorale]
MEAALAGLLGEADTGADAGTGAGTGADAADEGGQLSMVAPDGVDSVQDLLCNQGRPPQDTRAMKSWIKQNGEVCGCGGSCEPARKYLGWPDNVPLADLCNAQVSGTNDMHKTAVNCGCAIDPAFSTNFDSQFKDWDGKRNMQDGRGVIGEAVAAAAAARAAVVDEEDAAPLAAAGEGEALNGAWDPAQKRYNLITVQEQFEMLNAGPMTEQLPLLLQTVGGTAAALKAALQQGAGLRFREPTASQAQKMSDLYKEERAKSGQNKDILPRVAAAVPGGWSVAQVTKLLKRRKEFCTDHPGRKPQEDQEAYFSEDSGSSGNVSGSSTPDGVFSQGGSDDEDSARSSASNSPNNSLRSASPGTLTGPLVAMAAARIGKSSGAAQAGGDAGSGKLAGGRRCREPSGGGAIKKPSGGGGSTKGGGDAGPEELAGGRRFREPGGGGGGSTKAGGDAGPEELAGGRRFREPGGGGAIRKPSGGGGGSADAGSAAGPSGSREPLRPVRGGNRETARVGVELGTRSGTEQVTAPASKETVPANVAHGARPVRVNRFKGYAAAMAADREVGRFLGE